MSAFQGQEGKVASEVHPVLGVVKQSSVSEETGGASFQRGGSEQGHGAGSGGREACGVTAAGAVGAALDLRTGGSLNRVA